MPYKFTPKILCLFFAFVVVTYYEDRYIGGVSFASIWKMPFILYFVFITYFKNWQKAKYFPLTWVGGIFCLTLLIHSNMFYSVLPEITALLKYVLLPSTFFFFLRYENNPGRIIKIFFWLSIFLIWNNIPYLMGIIPPKVQKDFSMSFGEEVASNVGFSGAYLTVHSQAVLMAAACLFLVFLIYRFPKKFSLHNPILIITIIIGLYCLYLSFARTGWLMFVIGVTIVFGNDLFNRQRMKRVITVMIVAFFCGGYFIQSNDSFKRRLFDERQYSSGNRMDEIGSGRLVITGAAVSNWVNSGFISILIGYGGEKGKEKMEEKIGVRLFAHNGFVEILETSGIIGIVWFTLVIASFQRLLRTSRSYFSPLAWCYFICWLLVGVVQEFTFVYLNIYLSGILALTYSINKRKEWRTTIRALQVPKQSYNKIDN